MRFKYLLLLLVLGVFSGCYEEDDIKVTEGQESFFTLPQGNHDFDKQIVEWRDKYGFYALYIYEDEDIFWNYKEWSEGGWGDDYKGGDLQYKCAETDYIGKQLDFFKKYFLNIYPETLLKGTMPIKVLLCSELWKTDREFVMYPDGTYEYLPVRIRRNIYSAYDFIAINGGSKEIDNMTVDQRNEFAREIGQFFCTKLLSKGLLKIPESFTKVSSYTYQKDLMGKELFKYGFLNSTVLTEQNTISQAQVIDFEYYIIMLITHSLERLNGDMDYVGNWDNSPKLGGVFNPEYDVNGLVKRKYDAVVNYLKEVGIDVSLYQYPEKE